jgi:hypothetical protein
METVALDTGNRVEKVVIARGIAMPFFPIRPFHGHVLRNQGNVEDFYWKELRKRDWVIQPKLDGDRACVGVLDKKVYIQNRHGSWHKLPVKNREDFAKLPSGTVLDGEVFEGNFYPFDCLALAGKSYLLATAGEREVLAFQCSKFLGHVWKFERPNKAWVAKLRGNLPLYGGVVLKRMGSPYLIPGDPSKLSLDWMKKCWG